MVIDNELQLKEAITGDQYDVALLSCDTLSWVQLKQVARVMSFIRATKPTCLILMHRPPFHHQMPIPSAPCDFLFDSYFNPPLLAMLAATLSFRQHHLLRQNKKYHPLRGMISVDSESGKSLSQVLTQHGIQIIPTNSVTNDFEYQFRQHYPDFVLLHCHNADGNSDVVKAATHLIRRLHPDCIIYITFSIGVLKLFADRYKINEYVHDELLSLPFSAGDLLELLTRSLTRRYQAPLIFP
nr:hypothetical protein [uncultured Chitinophaga sp.]